MFHRLFLGPPAEVPEQWAQAVSDVVPSFPADVVSQPEQIPQAVSDVIPSITTDFVSSPEQCAQAVFDVLSSILVDVVSHIDFLLPLPEQIPDSGLPPELVSTCENLIETAQNNIASLSPVIVGLHSYPSSGMAQAFLGVIDSINQVSVIPDSLSSLLHIPLRFGYPTHLLTVDSPYGSLTLFDPNNTTGHGHVITSLKYIWFQDKFVTIDPAIWSTYTQTGATAAIVGGKLNEVSSQVGGVVWIQTDDDDTIPEAFDLEFELKFSSGTGNFCIQVYTGVHRIQIYFKPDDILSFRQKDPAGYKDIDVGDFMGLTYTWKFVYNGTTVDIYRDGDLIDSDLEPFVDSTHAGWRRIWGQNVFTIFLDDYIISSG